MSNEEKKSSKSNEIKEQGFASALKAHIGDISISELARQTNLNRQQIHRYLVGSALPRADAFMALCNALDMDPFKIYPSMTKKNQSQRIKLSELPNVEAPSSTQLADGKYMIYRPSIRRPGLVIAKTCFISTVEGRRLFYVRYLKSPIHITTNKKAREIVGYVLKSKTVDTCQFVGYRSDVHGDVREIQCLYAGPRHPASGYRAGFFTGPDHYPSTIHPYATKAVLVSHPELTNKELFRMSGFKQPSELPVGVKAYFDQPMEDMSTITSIMPDV